MSLFNFINNVGPPVPASYLNALDLIRNALSSPDGITLNAVGALNVQGKITGQNGLEIVNGSLTVDNGITVANAGIGILAGGLSVGPGGGQVSLDAGSASVPSLGFTADGGVGIYRPASDTLGISTNGTPRMLFGPTGSITAYGTSLAALIDIAPDFGSYTGTFNGLSGSPTSTVVWGKFGQFGMILVPATSANSNSTGFTLTGALPTSMQPARSQGVAVPAGGVFSDAGAATSNASILMSAGSGTITFRLNNNAAGWTNTATTKGVLSNFIFPYLLT